MALVDDGAHVLRLRLVPRADLPRRLPVRPLAVGAARPAVADRRLRRDARRAAREGHGPPRPARATASTAARACSPARPASTSATACRWSASTARSAPTRATTIMTKVGRPHGLIRYTSRAALEAKTRAHRSCVRARSSIPRRSPSRSADSSFALATRAAGRRHRAARTRRAVRRRGGRPRREPAAREDHEPHGRRPATTDRGRRHRRGGSVIAPRNPLPVAPGSDRGRRPVRGAAGRRRSTTASVRVTVRVSDGAASRRQCSYRLVGPEHAMTTHEESHEARDAVADRHRGRARRDGRGEHRALLRRRRRSVVRHRAELLREGGGVGQHARAGTSATPRSAGASRPRSTRVRGDARRASLGHAHRLQPARRSRTPSSRSSALYNARAGTRARVARSRRTATGYSTTLADRASRASGSFGSTSTRGAERFTRTSRVDAVARRPGAVTLLLGVLAREPRRQRALRRDVRRIRVPVRAAPARALPRARRDARTSRTTRDASSRTSSLGAVAGSARRARRPRRRARRASSAARRSSPDADDRVGAARSSPPRSASRLPRRGAPRVGQAHARRALLAHARPAAAVRAARDRAAHDAACRAAGSTRSSSRPAAPGAR